MGKNPFDQISISILVVEDFLFDLSNKGVALTSITKWIYTLNDLTITLSGPKIRSFQIDPPINTTKYWIIHHLFKLT